MIDKEKIRKGQFNTKNSLWLKPQIIDFIRKSNCSIAYDPFAGEGDLLRLSNKYEIRNVKGLDIDPKFDFDLNDSLVKIPKIPNSIIITNPPYLSKYSASRKKILCDVKRYFDNSDYEDLYLIALDKALEASQFVLAIIPETFLNSSYKNKNRLSSVTILEENPFFDTVTPVCVACFDSINKKEDQIKIYKNDTYITSLKEINDKRIKVTNNLEVTFNSPTGWLGLRAVDSTSPTNMIRFDYKENFDYDWKNKIKISSRLLSSIDLNLNKTKRNEFIDYCNEILKRLRKESADLILSPFKGNMKNGVRRRRLDYYTARAIIERAYASTTKTNSSVM